MIIISRLTQVGIIALFLIFSAVSTYSQSPVFTVLHVMGNVYCGRLQKDLQTGDKIITQDKLRFNSTSAYLVVMSPQDGRKMVRPASQNVDTELKSLLSDIVSLEKRHTASRGGEEEDKQARALKKLKSQFEDTDTLLILGSGKASFGGSDFVLNDTAAVKARYRSGNSYAEMPMSTGSMMDLSKIALFGTQAPMKVQLIYFPNVKKDIFDSPPESLGSFVPRYFENDESLRNEVKLVINTLTGLKKEEVIAEIKRYIEDQYGPVMDENLLQWVTESNLLKP